MVEPVNNLSDPLFFGAFFLFKAIINLNEQLPKNRKLVIPSLKCIRNQRTQIGIEHG